jgi:hypothetical protein
MSESMDALIKIIARNVKPKFIITGTKYEFRVVNIGNGKIKIIKVHVYEHNETFDMTFLFDTYAESFTTKGNEKYIFDFLSKIGIVIEDLRCG